MEKVKTQTPGFGRRKSPRQRRSQVTVDVIKQAALDLARENAFGAAGTHDIANRAGVSVGSLYQYFPNREAIYLSLYEQTIAELVVEIKTELPEILDAPLPEAVRGTIQHLLKLYSSNRLVLLDMRNQLPELGLERSPISFQAMIHGSLRVFLAQRATQASAVENETKAFFLEQIMLGTIQNYVLAPPGRVNESEFTEHLSAIVLAYLRFEPLEARVPSPAW